MKMTISNTRLDIPRRTPENETPHMTKREAIARATLYFKKQGYDVEWTSARGIDIIVRNEHDGLTAFVIVQTFKGKSFPMQPFTDTKAHRNRYERLKEGVLRYIVKNRFRGLFRFDSVLVRDDGVLDHVTNRRTFRAGAI